MIPKFKEYFNPTLMFLFDENIHSKQELTLYLAEVFKLTEEDLKEKTSGESERKHDSRVRYTLTYLKRMELVASKKRGYYIITPKGVSFYKKNDFCITFEMIRDLEGYEQFQKSSNNNKYHWVEGHYRNGKYIPGYSSNWVNKGIRKRNDIVEKK